MRQPDDGSPKQVTQPDELTPMPRGWRLAGIVALLALAGIGLGLWQASSMRRLREAPAATVAVAWFENEDGDRSLEPLCEELPRQLQSRLAEVRGL
ncbi:MAG: hypothetical protein N2036_12325, partial [Bryobacteraceae bacterium]|nr:hypothetical protein [Bryobacteraceae bacterium]